MHMAMRPLLGKRQYYLRLDSDEVLATPLWSQCNDEQARDFPLELEALEGADYPPLYRIPRSLEVAEKQPAPVRYLVAGPNQKASEESSRKGTKGGPRPSKGGAPPILGTVSRKGILHHFGKVSDVRSQAFPLNFEFWVAADGCEQRVIVWSRLCEKYHDYVQVGCC